jgi:hypothetical protein
VADAGTGVWKSLKASLGHRRAKCGAYLANLPSLRNLRQDHAEAEIKRSEGTDGAKGFSVCLLVMFRYSVSSLANYICS